MTNEEGKELLDVLMDAGSKVTNARYKTALKKEMATVRFVDGGDVYIRPVSDMSTPTVITPTSVSDLDPGDIAMPNITWQLLSFGDIVEVVYAQSLNDGCIIRKVGVASSDFIAMSNATFMGVVDVVQRRTYATLNSVGWCRCLSIDFTDFPWGESFIINIETSRGGASTNTNAEIHCVRLTGVPTNASWGDEYSVTNTRIIDRMRFTSNGSGMYYVDIHYNSATTSHVAVNFNISTKADNIKRFNAVGMDSVLDAPSGETILTTYTFSANGFVPNQPITFASGQTYPNNTGDLYNTGDTVSNSPAEISMAASTYKTVAQFTLPKGKWIISGCIRWGMSTTGRRWCALATTKDANSNVAVLFVDEIRGWSDGSGHAYTKFCSVLSVSESTTYYLNGWQNSGAALAALGRLMAVRIC